MIRTHTKQKTSKPHQAKHQQKHRHNNHRATRHFPQHHSRRSFSTPTTSPHITTALSESPTTTTPLSTAKPAAPPGYQRVTQIFHTERVFGHGVDLAHVPRFVHMIEKWGDKFYSKALHPVEIEQIQKHATIEEKARFLASRWALKEALVKASAKRLLFYEMYMEREHRGKDPRPVLKTVGDVKEYFDSLGLSSVVTITHDGDYAMGSVILYQTQHQSFDMLVPEDDVERIVAQQQANAALPQPTHRSVKEQIRELEIAREQEKEFMLSQQQKHV